MAPRASSGGIEGALLKILLSGFILGPALGVVIGYLIERNSDAAMKGAGVGFVIGLLLEGMVAG